MDTTEGRSASPEPEPKIIGITGGIGSGKSTVAKIIKKNGFPIYSSDERAKEIVNDNPILKSKIVELLGENAYDENGIYNRKWVASLVFNNNDLLKKLNELIHPAVKEDFQKWIKQQNKDFIFKETALLFELGLDKDCHQSLLVTAEDNLRMKRVMDRDGKTYREVEAVMAKQMPEKDKIKRADFIIYNNEGIDELASETEKILQEITQHTTI
ncbi:MAG: dephospho-CoA kinase [Cruoricaptor ignavus]|nr:dephospho-CoA kinase [Cruoricaptor ignavus]